MAGRIKSAAARAGTLIFELRFFIMVVTFIEV
jgi:hypothetical protein